MVNWLFLFTRVQAFWGSVPTTVCPMHQIQKVSSWSLCQVMFQLLFPSLPKNLLFLAKFGSHHVTLLIQKKTTGISRKSQPPWGGHSPEETRKGTHSSLHTIYPKAHNLPSASSVSQLSKLCPTTYPLFGQVADPEKQQRSSSHCREEEARTACKAAPRGKEPLAGHKEGRLRLALERAMQRGLDHRGHEKKR